jgi:uncharacterized protein (DUF169 family)
MKSEIAVRLKLRYEPVAIMVGADKPAGASQFREGKWGCVAAMLSAAARGGQTVFDRKTYGCLGGGVGLGLATFTHVFRAVSIIFVDRPGRRVSARRGL